MTGFVSFIGAGPGRPELITLRGLQLLQRADVVLADDLVHPEIYLRYARPDAEIIRCGKRGGRPSTPQDHVNAMILHHAGAGKRVARLKGGDTMIFGRMREELDAVESVALPYEIVPGVTAASGCSAYAGPLLTERNRARAMTFMTGTTADGSADWAAAARLGTLVLYMGVTGLDHHAMELQAAGLSGDTPVTVVRWGSRGLQQQWHGPLVRIAELVREQAVRPPALVIIGAGQDSLQTLNWWTSKPLFGTTLLMFRPDERGWLLAERLRELGCEVQNLPTRRPQALTAAEPLDPSALHVFTSAQAVPWAPVPPAGSTVLAVGPTTAQALRSRGIACQSVGTGHTASLESYLRGQVTAGRVLQHWCGEDKRAELADLCSNLPVQYRPIPVYRMLDWDFGIEVAREMIGRAPAGSIVYATSPKTCAPVAQALRDRAKELLLWAIGDTTAHELRKAGLAAARVLGQDGLHDHDAQLEAALREYAARG